MKTIPKIILLTALIISGCQTQSVSKHLDLSFQEINLDGRHFYISQFSPKNFQLKITENTDSNSRKSIKEIHQNQSAALTFNGGFYDENFKPIGYLTSEGKNISALQKTNLLNGIFTIDKNQTPKLYNYIDFKDLEIETLEQIDFAVQSGPILIDQNGEIQVDQQNKIKANRSVIGIDKNNQLIVIIMRQNIFEQDKEITLYELASLLKNTTPFKEMGLHSIINLDGGTSTGLAIGENYYPELQKVQNIITVIPISKND